MHLLASSLVCGLNQKNEMIVPMIETAVAIPLRIPFQSTPPPALELDDVVDDGWPAVEDDD